MQRLVDEPYRNLAAIMLYIRPQGKGQLIDSARVLDTAAFWAVCYCPSWQG